MRRASEQFFLQHAFNHFFTPLLLTFKLAGFLQITVLKKLLKQLTKHQFELEAHIKDLKHDKVEQITEWETRIAKLSAIKDPSEEDEESLKSAVKKLQDVRTYYDKWIGITEGFDGEYDDALEALERRLAELMAPFQIPCEDAFKD